MGASESLKETDPFFGYLMTIFQLHESNEIER